MPRNNGHMNGLFTETGIIRMLEASDHGARDKNLSFLCALVDSCCDTNETAYLTRVFTMYINMV